MMYDISLPFDENIALFPGDPPFKRERVRSLDKGDRVNLSLLYMGAHTGTHIDAPLHMKRQGSDVARYAAEKLVGRARVIAIQNQQAVTQEELLEKNISGTKKLLLKTRNSTLWSQGGFVKDFVYLEETAAKYLAWLGVELVGFDYLSIEKFGAETFPAHLALMEMGVVIVEGLNLLTVPEGEYLLFCGALKIPGSDGAPARVVLLDPAELKTLWG